MKKIVILLILFTSLFSYGQCKWKESLKNDLYASNTEKNGFLDFFEVDNIARLQAYKILYNEYPSLKTNLEELILVSKNLDKIKSAGGYFKWKKLANAGDDALSKLLKNTDYKKFYDDLASGITTRQFKNILTLEEEAVLKYYTTNAGYKKFNQALRGEIKITDEFLAQEKLMNQALNKLPNSSHKNLYRIENLTEAQITSLYKEGDVITSKAFTSSTYSEEALIDAMRARSHTLLIRMKGKNGKLIEDLSTLKNEREILFKSKTKFKVTKVDYSANPNDDYMSKIRTVWLEEL